MIRLLWLSCLCSLISCSATKNYSPNKKFSPEELQEDYSLLKNALEAKHPSLYWFTSKDSMEFYFAKYNSLIKDSMNEYQFVWQVLSPLIDKIHCGHTSVNMSNAYRRWAQGKRFASFPLFLKIWNDTMAVTGSLDRKDSIFKRGMIIKAINGYNTEAITKKMFDYLPEDGNATTLNYIRISSNFPYFHRNIFGLSFKYKVDYLDFNGNLKTAEVPLYKPPADSSKKDSTKKTVRIPKQKKQDPALNYRSLTIDSSGYALINLNSFTKGNIRRFFRRSFKELRKKNIQHLILDIRSNSGGRIGLSTLLSKYISRQPFKVADTLFAKSKTVGPYTKYFEGKFLNNIQLLFTTKKEKDGMYHLRHLEKKLYKPKKKNHYNGNVYVLISGPTFSAAALFSNVVKGQNRIELIGEETGGGWHGNNGVMIPDFTLKNTKTRISFPLFRLVQYKHTEKNGSGILPDIFIGPNYEALIKGYDKKLEVVKKMIAYRLNQHN